MLQNLKIKKKKHPHRYFQPYLHLGFCTEASLSIEWITIMIHKSYLLRRGRGQYCLLIGRNETFFNTYKPFDSYQWYFVTADFLKKTIGIQWKLIFWTRTPVEAQLLLKSVAVSYTSKTKLGHQVP